MINQYTGFRDGYPYLLYSESYGEKRQKQDQRQMAEGTF
jgi:hypothetical protein